jgi:tRNA modification GTPase
MSAGTFVTDLQDTIVAIASGRSPAPRGIVRLAGPHVLDVIEGCFQPTSHPESKWRDLLQRSGPRRWPGRILLPHPATRATERGSSTAPVDLWLWPTSKTYTGQPSAEFHLAGVPYLMEQVVQRCLQLGARLAAPGEFTLRAFLAGRLDLLQAQAVLQVIEAQTPTQLQFALSQLAGGFSTPLQQLRASLIAVLAQLEAGLDFVDEDIEFISQAQLLQALTGVWHQVESLLIQLRERREIGRLPRVVLVGPPNAGKSSLFNALLGRDVAIVSAQAGTTRDYLSGRLRLGNQEVELIDTAGLSQPWDHTSSLLGVPHGNGESGAGLPHSETASPATTNDLDLLSQQQSWGLLPTADVVILCWDATRMDPAIRTWFANLPTGPALVILGKADLTSEPPALPAPLAGEGWGWNVPVVAVSAATGAGLEAGRVALQQAVAAAPAQAERLPPLLPTQSLEDLEQIAQALQSGIEIAAACGGDELVAAELHRAIDRLGRLVGTIYTDDILDSIFSQFCIGK